MDFSESTKVVYNRIQKIEPENVSKIIGYLLFQDHGERGMIRLAFSPDNLIHSLIKKAKAELGLFKPTVLAPVPPYPVNQVPVSELPLQFTPSTPHLSCPISSPITLLSASPYRDSHVAADCNVEYASPAYPDPISEDYHFQNPMQFLTLEDQPRSTNSIGSDFSSNYYHSEPAIGVRKGQRSPSLPEFPVKVCHYFSKGFCKHGNNCRYYHGNPIPESFSQILSKSSNDLHTEEKIFSPACLEKLEMELTELLQSRRGGPVSIASLPMIYYEKFGRILQAEGYLTESHRHGKAGYSLTKLLARLKNSICLVDRPHGQHSVMLAEDVPKYLVVRSDPGVIVAGSRQIYLTFPAESTFTEQDVSDYFNKFGLVQDVRIPFQQKRMFGFVTFVYAETVKQVLAKGNPHSVCQARVLVKPYKEKSRLVERKYADKTQHTRCYGRDLMDGDFELNSMVRDFDDSRLHGTHLIEEHEQAHDIESRHLPELQLTPKPLFRRPHFGYSMDELRLSEARVEQAEFQSAKRFSYLLDVLDNGSTGEDKESSCSPQGLSLP
ncbi:hypothetical protein I3843_04G185500 [Carya illinoinensis]|uniref:zinc finger CCCH domain-containing protein 18-like isoform X1 n=1 Tax=Carya illinoinensis TaxID=32201 RepID=UPI001BF68F3A|nr:zinc finger CCCH domain-containing protein 18-like isoform X1 [Carya illinoinensis]XP_042975177.1 zinc finger CCCH domain-containing protein 18-like isoform X1 [Carya illinoinensis]KAG2713851.1 hypothetical protein I3760_04G195200 [Carya illinoinensis]KAG7984932.1 hypothetical protein I3843_04G185500 [Carya illinoinensis]